MRGSSGRAAGGYDVAVVGAGPTGCVAALAHARAGARVLLLEANPRAAERLAGEWLHPGGLRVLEGLGLGLAALTDYDSGRGFAVFPEDGSAPIALPYADAARGSSVEHRAFVGMLREAAAAHADVVYLPGARALRIEGQRVCFQRERGARETRVAAGLVVGADGRASRVRAALGLPPGRVTLSRMAGLCLRGAELPIEGYGHVFLGGPGPILAYRIGADSVRVCLDVPLGAAADPAALWDAYAAALPAAVRPAFRSALRGGCIAWAVNQLQPRSSYGRPGLALVGDAVGFQHPLTAVGMTLGMADAAELARQPTFRAWRLARRRDSRVAEMLAGALYEAFSAETDPAAAIRRGVYELWRRHPVERERTMRYVAGEPGQLPGFARSFARVTAPALVRLAARAVRARDLRGGVASVRELGGRAAWLARGAIRAGAAPALPPRARAPAPAGPRAEPVSAAAAVARAAAALRLRQAGPAGAPRHSGQELRLPGGFEGEVAWCPMLAAQYVLLSHLVGAEIAPERRAGLLRHFERTRLDSGLWGLHELSPPYLFVTTLVYVAARLLGVGADAPELAAARRLFGTEGVVAIPSWGKFWLALLGLYDWRGVPPIVPELWALPAWLPLHPSRFYCHTRHIHLAMCVLYARKPSPAPAPRLEQIRSELHPGGYANVDWSSARRSLRRAELVTPPSLPLRLGYEAAAWLEPRRRPAARRRLLERLAERIRFELRSTSHTSLSPVSGFLNVLALRASDADDPDAKLAFERLEAWIWEDARDGTRIAGARSATWDSAFALQALAAAAPHAELEQALARGAAFLRGQQIRESFPGHREAFRLDPQGGFCFAGAWHGWPVSDCTAEAVEALLATSPTALSEAEAGDAVRFMLRCQNPDGGFGSYEARRSRLPLEWLNPAEMFGDSMSEHSYVECTASVLAALAAVRRHFPDLLRGEVEAAAARAQRRLRLLQRRDGAWPGVWGVHLIYGTSFGLRGLAAAGAGPGDPAVRRARRWLLARQRPDGGWGEAHRGCLSGEYVEHAESQVIHAAWALGALLEAGEPDWDALTRGARFLVERQQPSGGWPRQDPAGVFFRSALLDYELYRQYFPLRALALYETRRLARPALGAPLALSESGLPVSDSPRRRSGSPTIGAWPIRG